MAERLGVSALNRYVKLLLEGDVRLRSVWVEGELSGCSVNRPSGHMYFYLKDEAASAKCVMFKGRLASVKFIPKDGQKVLVRCRVTLYERDGLFELVAEDMLPLGAGEQNERLERLKQKLAAEGFFEPSRKRPLKKYPQSLAVVTSSSGAAVRDIINVVTRRWPVRLDCFHASVQGILAEGEIVAALNAIARRGGYDAVIIARGGGSKEDLWVFNSEMIIRAAARLGCPYISAVGHETDFTLLDFAADLRAPTPSAAAELAVPDREAVASYLSGLLLNCGQSLSSQLEKEKRRVGLLSADIDECMASGLERRRERFSGLARLCDTLSPMRVLGRGYCLAERGEQRIKGALELSPGPFSLRFADGTVDCEAIGHK